MAVVIDGSNTPTAGGVVYGDGTEYASTAAGSAGGVLYSAGSSAPAFTAAGTSGQLLQSNGASAPSWVTFSAGFTLGTPVNVSGTSVTFTGIPAGVKQVNIMFSGVSIDSTSDSAIIQLGDSGGIEANDYLGAYNRTAGGISTQFTSGFIVFDSTNTAFTYHGLLILSLQNSSTNTWAGSSLLAMSNASQTGVAAGTKALTGVLDRIRLTTINGSSSFDAGQINISYI